MRLFHVWSIKITQNGELTVVIHVLVDIVLRWEDLAHRSQKSLQHKNQFLDIHFFFHQVDRRVTGISVSLIICNNLM